MKNFRVRKKMNDVKFTKPGTAELKGWKVIVSATDNEDIVYVFWDVPLNYKDGDKVRKPAPGFVYTSCLTNLKFADPQPEPQKEPELFEAPRDVEQNLDTTIFPEDHRQSNPGLHMLYTKWAIPHLVELDKAITTFGNFSNLNMLGVVQALFAERKKLVTENAAYAEADEILKSIRKRGGISAEEVS